MTVVLAPALDTREAIREAALRAAWWFAGARQGGTAAVRLTTVGVAPAAQNIAHDPRFDPLAFERLSAGGVELVSAQSATQHLERCKAWLETPGAVLATHATAYRSLTGVAGEAGFLLNGDDQTSPTAPLAWCSAALWSDGSARASTASALGQMRALVQRADRAVVVGGEVSAGDLDVLAGEIVALSPDGPWEAVLAIDPALTIICLDDPVRHLGPSRAAGKLRASALRRLSTDPRTALAVPAKAFALLADLTPAADRGRVLTVDVPIAIDAGPGFGIAACSLLAPQVDVLWPGNGLVELAPEDVALHPAFARSVRETADLTELIARLEGAGAAVRALSRSAFKGLRERDRGRALTAIARQDGTPWPASATSGRFADSGTRTIAVTRDLGAVVPFVAVDVLSDPGDQRRLLASRLHSDERANDPHAEIDRTLDALDALTPQLELSSSDGGAVAAAGGHTRGRADAAATTADDLREQLLAEGHPLPAGPFGDSERELRILDRYRRLLTGGLQRDHMPRFEQLVKDTSRPAIVFAADAPLDALNANRLAGMTAIFVDISREDIPYGMTSQPSQTIQVATTRRQVIQASNGPRIVPVREFVHARRGDILVDPRDFGFPGEVAPTALTVGLARALGVPLKALVTSDQVESVRASLASHGIEDVCIVGADASTLPGVAFHRLFRQHDWAAHDRVVFFLPDDANFSAWQSVMDGLGEGALTMVIGDGGARVIAGDNVESVDDQSYPGRLVGIDDLASEIRSFGPSVAVSALEQKPPVALAIPMIRVVPPTAGDESDRPPHATIATDVPLAGRWPNGSQAIPGSADIDRLRVRLCRQVRTASGGLSDRLDEHHAGAAFGPWFGDSASKGEWQRPPHALGTAPAGGDLVRSLWRSLRGGRLAKLTGLPVEWLGDVYQRQARVLAPRWGLTENTPSQLTMRNVDEVTVHAAAERGSGTLALASNQVEGAVMPQSTFSALWPWPGTILLTLLTAWLIYMGSIADLADVRTAFYGMAFVTGIAVLLGLRAGVFGSSRHSGEVFADEYADDARVGGAEFPATRSRFDAPRRSITDGDAEGDDQFDRVSDGMPQNARMRANNAAIPVRREAVETDESPVARREPAVDAEPTMARAREPMVEDVRAPRHDPRQDRPATEPAMARPATVDASPVNAALGNPDMSRALADLSDQFQAAMAREKAERGAALAQINQTIGRRLDQLEESLRVLADAAPTDGVGAGVSEAASALSGRVDELGARLNALSARQDSVGDSGDGGDQLAALSERVAAIEAGSSTGEGAPIADLEKRLESMVTVSGLNNMVNTKLLPSIDKRIGSRLEQAISPDALKEKLGEVVAGPVGAVAESPTVEALEAKLTAAAKDSSDKLQAVRKEANEAIAAARRSMQAEILALREAMPAAGTVASDAVSALQSRLEGSDHALGELRDGLSALRSTVDATKNALAEGGGGAAVLEEITGRLNSLEEAALAAAGKPLQDTVDALEQRLHSGLQDTGGAINAVRTGLRDLANNVSKVSDHYSQLLSRVDDMGATLAAAPPAAGGTVQAEMDTLREQLLTIIEQNREIKAQQQAISETFSQPARIEFGRGN